MNEDVNMAASASSRAVKSQQFTELVLSRTDFNSEVLGLRKKWGIPKDGLGDGAMFDDWYVELNDNSNNPELLEKDIIELIRCKKYGIGGVALGTLWLYVVSGRLMDSFIGVLPNVTTSTDKKTKQTIYTMRFYQHTTEIEVRQTFNNFKAKNIKDKRQHIMAPIKLEKMKLAYELREQNMKWKDVAEEVNTKLGGFLQYNDARKLVERYKKIQEM